MGHEPSARSETPLVDQYGEAYYRHYSHSADTPYSRDDPAWTAFFGGMAQRIVGQLQPRTVLDAGCAMGLLVEALRDRGVEAWGLDFSRYAINQVRADIREYCRVASVTDDLGRAYDLITCIEVLEHLPAEDADKAVANFAQHTDIVLLSSTPDDFRESSHLNVQPTDYWVGLFARHGLYRDLDYDAHFISQHAMLFRRQRGLPIDALRAYERGLWQSQLETRELRVSYQTAVEAQRRQEADLEHHEFERGLLSGEVAHWASRSDLVRDDPAERQSRATETKPKFASPLRQAMSLLQRAVRRAPGSRQAKEAQPPSVHPAHSPGDARRVLFISDGTDAPRRYRCDHQAESLRLRGWSADMLTLKDTSGFLAPYLDSFDAFVLHRLPLRPNLESFMQAARERGKPLVYDTDDLIFEPDLASVWEPFASLPDQERWPIKHQMWRNRQTLRRCAGVIVANEPLRAFAHKLNDRVYVSTNAVSQAMLSSAEKALAAGRAWQAGDPITLAYVCDSPNYTRDFSQVADAVLWALETHSATRVLVVGPLELPAQFAPLEDRVQRLTMLPWDELAPVLAQVCLALAPVEPNNPFSEATSCVRYLEAGLLGIPTIASPRHDFASLIQDGQNGLLSDSAEGWQKALSALIDSPSLRACLGARAREDVLRRHTTATGGYHLQALIDGFVTESAGSRG